MAKSTTDATFEAEILGLGRALGNLVWSMSYASVILEKLSEELSEDELKILGCGRKSRNSACWSYILSQPCSLKKMGRLLNK